MGQHIGCIIQDEQGNVYSESKLSFTLIYLAVYEHDKNRKKYVWLSTIDPYGDTVFNPIQTPFIIHELKILQDEVDQDLKILIEKFIVFIETIGIHQYVKFIGD
jgi:hypothetical protein